MSLLPLQALRGLVALWALALALVVGFDQRFVHEGLAGPALGHGAWAEAMHWGVGCFFLLAGHGLWRSVAHQPGAAVWCTRRLLRLVPLYWAAVLVCGALLAWAAWPGQVRSARELLGHAVLVPQLLGIAPVDNAWWAVQAGLCVGLCWLLLWQAGGLSEPRRVWPVLAAWLGLSLLAAALQGSVADPLAGTVQRVVDLLALPWVPWFVLGASVGAGADTARQSGDAARWPQWAVLGLGWVAVVVWQGVATAGMAVVGVALLQGAQDGRWPAWLCRVLAPVGAVAYPLFLVQGTVGTLVILGLAQQVGTALAVLAAAAAALLLASALHVVVQRPMRRALPAGASASAPAQAPPRRRPIWIVGVLLAMAGLWIAPSVVSRLRHVHPPAHWALAAQPTGPACPSMGAPVIVLVMGQSNAASHAERVPVAGASGSTPLPQPVPVWRDGRCVLAADPLPGTTGEGASLWTALADTWPALWPQHQVVLAPLAVENTRLAAWVGPGRLRDELDRHLADVARSGWPVGAVLWQQGEADMVAGTPANQYLRELAALRERLDAHGLHAALVVARSTHCRHDGTGALHRALLRLHATDAIDRVLPGPDTDRLTGAARDAGGCHFSAAGRLQAAQAWSQQLQALRERLPPPAR